MSVATAMPIEILLQSLKEVKNAKSCLEHKQDIARQKRREMQASLDADHNAMTQVKGLYTKMLETSQVARHKAAQTQAQFNKLEEESAERRTNIEDLEKKLEEEEMQHLMDIRDFEADLSKLSGKLVQAREDYSEPRLTEKILESEKQIESYKQEGASDSALHLELQRLDEELTKLEAFFDEAEDSAPDRASVWNMFLEEEKQAQEDLKVMVEEMDSDLETLKNFYSLSIS